MFRTSIGLVVFGLFLCIGRRTILRLLAGFVVFVCLLVLAVLLVVDIRGFGAMLLGRLPMGGVMILLWLFLWLRILWLLFCLWGCMRILVRRLVLLFAQSFYPYRRILFRILVFGVGFGCFPVRLWVFGLLFGLGLLLGRTLALELIGGALRRRLLWLFLLCLVFWGLFLGILVVFRSGGRSLLSGFQLGCIFGMVGGVAVLGICLF